MTVIKRSRAGSTQDLCQAVGEFIGLLEDQNEEDAIADLKKAVALLSSASPGDESHAKGLALLNNAFFDEHELNSYVVDKPKSAEWSIIEQLSLSATRVVSLLKRFK